MPQIPFARKRLIPPGSSDPRITARIGILHVDAGNAASLYDYFKDRSGGIESHGHIQLGGQLEQYRDTSFQADANNLANDFALSFETQGFGAGKWTDAQLETIKRVMLWSREVHGIPLRKVTSWNDAKGGWGYHTLFGSPSQWTPVAKSCPGAERIKQFHEILVPWMAANQSMTLAKFDGDVAKPTRNITAALKAKGRAARIKKLKKVVRHGGREAQGAAAEYINALNQLTKAEARVRAARAELKKKEVRS